MRTSSEMKERAGLRGRDSRALLVVALAILASCGEVSSPVASRTQAELLARGPFAVGVAQTTFVDTSRPTQASGSFSGSPERRLDCWVWYPLDRPADGVASIQKIAEPSRGGPFPLVMLSHGLSSPPNAQTYLTHHLASHGYVVVAPTFPLTSMASHTGQAFGVSDLTNQPGDVSFVLDRVLAIAGGGEPTPEGLPDLRGVIDVETVAAAGLSFGAFTTHLLNFETTLRDERLDAAVLYAVGDMTRLPEDSGAPGTSVPSFTPRSAPSLYFSGSRDLLTTPEGSLTTWSTVRSPSWHAEIVGGTHLWFADANSHVDGYENPDRFACEFVRGGIGGSVGADVLACVDDGTDPIIDPPVRQHELVLAGTLAFLDAILRDDAASRAFLESGFDGDGDVRVSTNIR